MLSKIKIKNRRAGIGETVTWFVATIAIVVILVISITASSFAFPKGSGVKAIKTTDVLASKSLFAHSLTEGEDGKTVYEQIKQDKLFSKSNGELGQKIFIKFYLDSNEYSKVWLGVIDNQGLSSENNFFGKRTFGVKEEFSPSSPHVSQTIKLDEQNNLNLMLYGKK